jgi:serine protease Do
MRRFVTLAPALVVMVTTATVLLVAPTAVRRIGHAATAVQVQYAQDTLATDDILERLDRAVSSIAKAVEPSVVHIDVRTPDGDRSTTGSGWVLDREGHVVTNSHVVRGAELVRVEFNDGRVVAANVVGADPFTDIAVLKVRLTEGLFPVRIARGSLPKKGERVFAFGSPFGFKFSMSEGIVSGLARNPSGSLGLGGYTNFIQTDAAVNPGNSGGPLVDVRGELVGMNVAIATGRDAQGTQESGDSAGISFAIPVGTIEPIVQQLIAAGSISRGFVGVRFRPGSDRLDLPDGTVRKGVVVTEVIDPGPAAQAGLRIGDAIVRIQGYPVTDSTALAALISSGRAGDEIAIDVLRDGAVVPLSIRLGEMPVENMLDRIAGQLDRQLGLRVNTVYLDDGSRGVAIMSVADDSIANRVGLRPGQLVEQIGGVRVTSALELLEAVYQQGMLSRGHIPFVVADLDDPDNTRKTVMVRIYP